MGNRQAAPVPFWLAPCPWLEPAAPVATRNFSAASSRPGGSSETAPPCKDSASVSGSSQEARRWHTSRSEERSLSSSLPRPRGEGTLEDVRAQGRRAAIPVGGGRAARPRDVGRPEGGSEEVQRLRSRGRRATKQRPPRHQRPHRELSSDPDNAHFSERLRWARSPAFWCSPGSTR